MAEPAETGAAEPVQEQLIAAAVKDESSLIGALNTLEISQDWKAGSRCRVMYSEDGLVYPAVVLWVRGRRCCVRFDDYNNEEEHDLSSLLTPDELHGPSRAAAAKSSNWRSNVNSSNFDWKRRRREEDQGERGGERWRGENQGERGGERTEEIQGERGGASREEQVKDRPSNRSKVEKETEEKKKRGNQQRDEADKPTSHSFSVFPPFPPPPHASSGDPVFFIPPPLPPPPPLWMFGESDSSAGVNAMSSMLMLWYMCGFHTGSYMAQQLFRSNSKD